MWLLTMAPRKLGVIPPATLCCSQGCLAVYRQRVHDRINAWVVGQGYDVQSCGVQAMIDRLIMLGTLAGA
jgi:hypothetical protein